MMRRLGSTMMRRLGSAMLGWVVLLGGGAGVVVAAGGDDDSILNSPHDLSAGGRGPIRAVEETEVCIFCHTPHNASPQTPLWNRHNPRTHYRIYESSTLDARVDQPSGPSKLCLSCHDGSLALGAVLSRPARHPIITSPRTIPPGPSDLTNDLSDDHPIGFRYDRAVASADPQIRVPELISRELPLGRHSEVHCTTCHDPHDNSEGKFLRITDRYGTICTTCHNMDGWSRSEHARSRASVRGRAVDPREPLNYRTVGENACLNCHKIHGATERERLLRHRREELNCLTCHDGSVARTNILADIRKSSAHEVFRYTGVHDAAEDPFTMRRHAECVDCHNPHAVQADHVTTARRTRGRLATLANRFVSGVSASGVRVRRVSFTYEVCFKCHGDSVARPRRTVRRQVTETNRRLQFQTSNPSYHPVIGPRRNRSVVSLIPPLRQGSVITCTDCHASDNARSAGGTGPNGPHGSVFEPLLAANYETRDFTIESAASYALCYRCHDRTSILNGESFPLHNLHVVQVRAPCAACHDPHGVRRFGVGDGDHTNLINFNLSIVRPADGPTGSRIAYEDTGLRRGNCTLTCHGMTHINFPYSP
ncbi:MAG: cytochrome c3 family protein [Phycisphaerae bacterium]